jgi:hypothetical protein
MYICMYKHSVLVCVACVYVCDGWTSCGEECDACGAHGYTYVDVYMHVWYVWYVCMYVRCGEERGACRAVIEM